VDDLVPVGVPLHVLALAIGENAELAGGNSVIAQGGVAL
jgi:hypothetical protein